jgi:hypothetical protein
MARKQTRRTHTPRHGNQMTEHKQKTTARSAVPCPAATTPKTIQGTAIVIGGYFQWPHQCKLGPPLREVDASEQKLTESDRRRGATMLVSTPPGSLCPFDTPDPRKCDLAKKRGWAP